MNSNTERTISHDEAREAALALIDHWFQNANGRRVQTRIPVDPTDTDVVLTDYIEQQRNAEAELSRIRTLLSDRVRLSEEIDEALDTFVTEQELFAMADKLRDYLLSGTEGTR